MQDAGKFPLQKPNTNGEAAPDAQRAKQERDAADKPALKVTFERPETRDALKSPEKSVASVALVPEPAPANSYRSDAAPAATKDTKSQDTKSQDTKSGVAIPLIAKPETSDAVTRSEPHETHEIPSTSQLLTAPLLAIVAALSLLAAGWSYASLTETRAQLASTTEALTAATADKASAAKAKLAAEKALAAASIEKASAAQAKVSAEKALNDAQTRLAAVERTVAEIKAALAAIVTSAAPASGPADTSPAK